MVPHTPCFLLEGATSPIFLGTLCTPQSYGTTLEPQIFNLDSIFGDCTQKRVYLGLTEENLTLKTPPFHLPLIPTFFYCRNFLWPKCQKKLKYQKWCDFRNFQLLQVRGKKVKKSPYSYICISIFSQKNIVKEN